MKVIIEIDLPSGHILPDLKMIERLASPDWMAVWWHVDDVKRCIDYPIGKLQAREILECAYRDYNHTNGLNLETLKIIADEVADNG